MRFVRGLAALLALAGLLVGIPFALAVFGGNPLPDDLSGQALLRAFFAPASDRVLLGIVAVVGWHIARALAPADMKAALLREGSVPESASSLGHHGAGPHLLRLAPQLPGLGMRMAGGDQT